MKKIIVLLLLAQTVLAQSGEPPKLAFVCELKVTVDKAISVGQTAHGERRIIPITGGTFEGPLLRGTVIPGGADYQFANQGNTRTEVEAIYTIKTDDGVLIHIRNVGLVVKTKEAAESLLRGGNIDWSKMYFRATPRFEAPQDSKYDWLNNAIFVCRGVPSTGYVSILVWQIL